MKKNIKNIKEIHDLNKWQCATCLYKYFKKNNVKKEEKLLFTLYYWYGVGEFISFKILSSILNDKMLSHDNKNIKSVKKYGAFHIYDEGIFLKTWPCKGQKIIPRNFVKELEGMESFHIFQKEIKKVKAGIVIPLLFRFI